MEGMELEGLRIGLGLGVGAARERMIYREPGFLAVV